MTREKTTLMQAQLDTKTGGGALGGRPEPATAHMVAPDAVVPQEDLPAIRTDELEPSASSRESRSALQLAGLRPSLVRSKDS